MPWYEDASLEGEEEANFLNFTCISILNHRMNKWMNERLEKYVYIFAQEKIIWMPHHSRAGKVVTQQHMNADNDRNESEWMNL
jgi:hypothetical protein